MVLAGWGIARIVTTGDARSDDATGADHCCSKAGNLGAANPAEIARAAHGN